MPNPNRNNNPEKNEFSIHDRITASVAMIDYLIIEVEELDPMCAHCLKVARKRLAQDEGNRIEP